jgi:hypothetical protein
MKKIASMRTTRPAITAPELRVAVQAAVLGSAPASCAADAQFQEAHRQRASSIGRSGLHDGGVGRASHVPERTELTIEGDRERRYGAGGEESQLRRCIDPGPRHISGRDGLSSNETNKVAQSPRLQVRSGRVVA